MAEHEDVGVHVRVDVAEDADDARLVEADGLGPPGRIATEIEPAGLREREDVVIDRVGVGKVYRRAGHDREDVRHEGLVALIHHGPSAVIGFERPAWRRLEVDDRAQQIGQVAWRRRAEIGHTRAARRRCGSPTQIHAPANGPRPRRSDRRRVRRDDEQHGDRGRDAERSDPHARRESRRQNQNTTCVATRFALGVEPTAVPRVVLIRSL